MDLRSIAGVFDARAARYAGDDWHRRYAEQLVEATPLRPGDRVLDAGTGTGFAALATARRVGPAGHVVGVDISPGMLTQARRAIAAAAVAKVEVVEADTTDLRGWPAATFDVVLCAAGLLYMPVATALASWRRLLKPGGVVAFSTMRAGSPSAGRIFRECAAGFGLTLSDPSAALGTADRCRAALASAGFAGLQVIDARVDFERVDGTLAWEANFRAAGLFGASALSIDQQSALREQYLRALEHAQRADPAAAAPADVLLAIGHRAESPQPAGAEV
jgi:SAM-dependent methyltransferase